MRTVGLLRKLFGHCTVRMATAISDGCVAMHCSLVPRSLGVVQTAEGLPLYHEVFDGNTAEVTTLKGVIETIVKRFPIKRVIAVADRGLLSTDNLAQWVGKLDEQDAGKPKRGRKLSDGGARARFYHEVHLAHLARIIKVDLKSELFSYSIDERALKHARLMDGHRSSTPLLRFFDFSRPARQ